jgi:hypothetical protein
MKTNWKQITRILEDRCNGFCEYCGTHLNDNWARHHRLLRSQGGQDDVTNLLALHHGCHQIIHANPNVSYRNGWMVRSTNNPKDTPVFIAGVGLSLLTEKGRLLTEKGSHTEEFLKDVSI